MLLNKQRERVGSCQKPDAATCPLCDGRLVAKRPAAGLHHWAHYPQPHDAEKCPHHESWWHLKMKLAALQMGAGWQIEVPIVLEGQRWLVDVARSENGVESVIEFVHTLTPYYLKKYEVLSRQGYDIRYLLDGREFVSRRARNLYFHKEAQSRVRLFLKPKARKFTDNMLAGRGILSGLPDRDRVHVHTHEQLGNGYELPLGEGVKENLDERDRVWCVAPPRNWLGELQPMFEKIDLDDHRNNPEIIQDRVRKVEVKKLVEWL